VKYVGSPAQLATPVASVYDKRYPSRAESDAEGARVFNTVTGHWERWPVYYSATDPATGSEPPAGDYVWQQL